MIRYIAILTLLLSAKSINAQDSLVLFQKKNNIKVSVLTVGTTFTSGLIVLGNSEVKRFAAEFERNIGNKQTFTITPTYSYYKSSLGSRTNISGYLELGLGYNYYLLQQNKENPFKGIYLGSSLFGGQNTSKLITNGNVTLKSNAYRLGLGLKLGTQTSLFKIFTIGIEATYRADKLYSDKQYFSFNYMLTTLRLGLAF